MTADESRLLDGNAGGESWINRDLSWLAFNERVLANAGDIDLPLLDRLKFLAIVFSNLDEFFMVRVALIRRALQIGEPNLGPDGMTPRQLLDAVRERARHMMEQACRCWSTDIRPALASSSVDIVEADDLSPSDRKRLADHFREQILPVLTPLVVDSTHPFPLLSSGSVYILFRLSPRTDVESAFFGKADTALVQIPSGLDRFVGLAGIDGATRVILLDDIVVMFAGEIFGGYDIVGAYPFRILRDADLNIDGDRSEDLILAVQDGLKRSRWGLPVRLTLESGVPDEEAAYLSDRLELEAADIFRQPGMLDMKGLFGLLSRVDRPDLIETPWPPQMHPSLPAGSDIFERIGARDIMLSLPYQSFDPVTKLIETAADDPSVLAIKITLYRVSGQSPLVRALIRAAEHKKQVTALVELQARFDEEANIGWAQRLDAAGAHVIYGVVGYKTHSKAALVIRREAGGIRRYCHLATGNYNDRTARQYTDLGLFTADPAFGSDISSFFNVITGYSLPPAWNHIEMAPTGLRTRIIAMIRREAEKQTPGNPGRIRAKMNSLNDPEIIRELYRAGQAGVRIDLLVRGICRLRPGVPGLSENISVRSVVDRFLEHPRIFHYRNGGDEEVYLSSADWMERNMDRRLELLFPVNDPPCREEALAALEAGFSDNVSAWELTPDGTYVRRRPASREPLIRSQAVLYARAVEMAATSRNEDRHSVFRVRGKRSEKRKGQTARKTDTA
ncbi:MAG: polyphosphate kinase 1 [Planctomycetota bacterium]|jgi:polyphosphate kinase|nr:polyphosphate kinase 1 [Planctomycetota bacterium]